jgi:hypothetical protein
MAPWSRGVKALVNVDDEDDDDDMGIGEYLNLKESK